MGEGLEPGQMAFGDRAFRSRGYEPVPDQEIFPPGNYGGLPHAAAFGALAAGG